MGPQRERFRENNGNHKEKQIGNYLGDKLGTFLGTSWELLLEKVGNFLGTRFRTFLEKRRNLFGNRRGTFLETGSLVQESLQFLGKKMHLELFGKQNWNVFGEWNFSGRRVATFLEKKGSFGCWAARQLGSKFP